MIYTHLMSIFKMTEVAFFVLLYMTQFQYCSFFTFEYQSNFENYAVQHLLFFLHKTCQKVVKKSYISVFVPVLRRITPYISSFDLILQGLNFYSSHLSIDKEKDLLFMSLIILCHMDQL